MLRNLSLIFVTAIVLVVLGCGGQDSQATAAPADRAAPADATTEPAAAPETVTAQPTATTAPPPTETPAPTAVPTPTPDAIQEDLFLQLVNPAETEVFVSEPTIEIVGRTRVDAVVTVNDTLLVPEIDGRFSLNVDLEIGTNIVEVVASVASGEQMDLVLVVVYLP